MDITIRDEFNPKKTETIAIAEDYSAYAYAVALFLLLGSVAYLFILSL
jgi:hypothetical protein